MYGSVAAALAPLRVMAIPNKNRQGLAGGTDGYLGLDPTRHTHHNFMVPAVQVSGESLEAFSYG